MRIESGTGRRALRSGRPGGRRRAARAGILAAALAFSAPAGATILELNDPSLGNPPDQSGLTDDSYNLTRDTATGLDWLDLQLTHALSYNTVQSGALIQAEGFRYASADEVASLYESAGLVNGGGAVYTSAIATLANLSTLTALGLDMAGFQALFAKVEALVFALGVSGGSTDDRQNYAIGITGTPYAPIPGTYLVAGLSVHYSPYAPCCDPYAFSIWIGPNSFGSAGYLGAGGASGQVSSFLVREAAVPEPGGAALFAVGLGALALAKRRR